MNNINKCQIKIEVEFGKINQRSMQVQILHNNTCIPVDSTGIVEFEITLPTTVVLQISGKNYNTDTIVGSDGNILEDMFVKLVALTLDGFPLRDVFLHQNLTIVTDNNEKITTSYFGFNGTVTIDLHQDNVFEQYLLMNNL